MNYANVLGVRVDAIDMERALARIKDWLSEGRKGYINVVGVHGIMEAQRDADFRRVYGQSVMNVPDGMPTVWVGWWQGHQQMQRVTGPDLMREVFRQRAFINCRHFLCGGKPGVAEELADTLRARFPWARIVGTYTPPFHELNEAEAEHFVSRVRRVQPDIVWVGISTPKQEQFMNRFLPLLDTTLMIGVGAAFDYHTGRIKDAPEWVKRAGLQWVNRLAQDPRHLWWRYLRNNPAFVLQIALQFLGVREYPDVPAVEVLSSDRVAAGQPQRAHAGRL